MSYYASTLQGEQTNGSTYVAFISDWIQSWYHKWWKQKELLWSHKLITSQWISPPKSGFTWTALSQRREEVEGGIAALNDVVADRSLHPATPMAIPFRAQNAHWVSKMNLSISWILPWDFIYPLHVPLTKSYSPNNYVLKPSETSISLWQGWMIQLPELKSLNVFPRRMDVWLCFTSVFQLLHFSGFFPIPQKLSWLVDPRCGSQHLRVLKANFLFLLGSPTFLVAAINYSLPFWWMWFLKLRGVIPTPLQSGLIGNMKECS